MFPYNGGNRPESKTTRMFRPVRQVEAPEAKSAISDCILFMVRFVVYDITVGGGFARASTVNV